MLDFLDAGVGPIPAGPSGRVPFPFESYATPILDLTVANPGLELVPARPGYFAQLSSSLWVIESTTGTQTAPATFQAGDNITHDNVMTSTSTPSNTDVNTAQAPSRGSGGTAAADGLMRNPGRPIVIDVTAAAGTGSFTLRARFIITVWWFAEGNA